MRKACDLLSGFSQETGKKVFDGHPFLLHGVPVTESDGILELRVLLAEGFEVHGDTKRSADFVLSSVAPANCSGGIIEDRQVTSKLLLDLPADSYLILIFLKEGKNGCLDGSHPRMETHDRADLGFPFSVHHFLFVKSLTEKGEDSTVTSSGGFYHVGDKLFLGRLVEILNRFSGVLLVFGEVVVGPIGYSLEFLTTEGEIELNIVGFLGVVCALSVRHVKDVQFLPGQADVLIKGESLFKPFICQSQPVSRPAEVFDLHLLEFTGSKSEIPGVDFISECLSDLGDTKGYFHPGRIENVLELGKDGLRGFWSQVGNGTGVILAGGGSHLGFEHEVEFPRLSQERSVFRIEAGCIVLLGSGFPL